MGSGLYWLMSLPPGPAADLAGISQQPCLWSSGVNYERASLHKTPGGIRGRLWERTGLAHQRGESQRGPGTSAPSLSFYYPFPGLLPERCLRGSWAEVELSYQSWLISMFACETCSADQEQRSVTVPRVRAILMNALIHVTYRTVTPIMG